MTSGSVPGRYKHPAVRDLAWALLSPQLARLTGDCDREIWDPVTVTEILNATERNPDQLLGLLQSAPPSRLGAYFELLITYYLRRCPRVEEICSNLRVQSGNRTLGEFDCLYRPQGAAGFTHLEIAVKFYLCLEDSRRPDHWMGLNPTDLLSRKLSRMRNHQLKLADLPEARALLAEKQMPVEQKLSLIRGRLFYPAESFRRHQGEHPDEVEAGHLRGWWLRADEFPQQMDFSSRFRVLSRLHWLADSVVAAGEIAAPPLLTANQAGDLVSDRPLMVARMVQDPHGWQEQDRGVLLPRHWPDLD